MRPSLLTVAITTCLLFVFHFSLPAQDKPVSEAPIVWERYRATGRNESILLPKLPIAMESFVSCSDAYTMRYYAYADDAVYEFTLNYKGKLVTNKYCTETRHFGQAALDRR